MAKKFKNKTLAWLDYRLPIFSVLREALVDHPTPRNLNYWWNFGSLAGIILVIMIVSGLLLSMHYVAHVDLAFDSIEHIMRDVNYGWLIRYIHSVGASMFFLIVYIHIARGLYYGSYKSPREVLWWLGIIIFLLMIASAFLGYTLPWGQMSFWGATVITNLFSAIPLVGDSIVTWLWGGFSVDNPTLNRFYSLHFLIPFIIVGIVFLHIIALHKFGSNNPTGIDLSRINLIVAILEKYCDLKLSDKDIFISLAKGIRVKDISNDLAVAISIYSSFKDMSVINNSVFIGELGLSGDVKKIDNIEKRIKEIARLGFKYCIVPKNSKNDIQIKFNKIKILEIEHIKEIEKFFN